ncbi:hypothetical protein [Blautia sp. MSJ-19]|uniref:hypothetical protein n=1 Tax=Blautia sp. MSJ-19 TaxID=2841517 RepID=UPI001C0EF68E|nr:hypothetical protein [Blautia sp. MSJ-19]MBU5481513.1 hypothetical protein [Blautia sp. MSJ-19]
MRYRDEVHIAIMTLLFCCAMFAVYAIVPKDAAVAARARATITEAPETAAEAEAIRSSQEEDAGFTIYTEESNYDYNDSDSSDNTTSDSSDQTYYDPGTDTSDSDVVDEDASTPGSTDPADQIDYPSDDTTNDTTDTIDSSDDTWEYFPSDTTDTSDSDVADEDNAF